MWEDVRYKAGLVDLDYMHRSWLPLQLRPHQTGLNSSSKEYILINYDDSAQSTWSPVSQFPWKLRSLSFFRPQLKLYLLSKDFPDVTLQWFIVCFMSSEHFSFKATLRCWLAIHCELLQTCLWAQTPLKTAVLLNSSLKFHHPSTSLNTQALASFIPISPALGFWPAWFLFLTSLVFNFDHSSFIFFHTKIW